MKKTVQFILFILGWFLAYLFFAGLISLATGTTYTASLQNDNVWYASVFLGWIFGVFMTFSIEDWEKK